MGKSTYKKRTKHDPKWVALKEKVLLRDKRDQLFRVLTAKEGLLLQKVAPTRMLKQLDPAHVFPVGRYPHLCYLEDNVVLLNRWSHQNLDDCKHPVTGQPIDKVEAASWWEKIVGKEKYKELLEEALNGRAS